ncbi:MAG: hypothetical protein MH137_03640 [Flavobacteriales bacterium]|nr:hypothetical protein [Flavobacteriales bacterium]
MSKPDFIKYKKRDKIGGGYLLKTLVAVLILFALGYLTVEFFRIFTQSVNN